MRREFCRSESQCLMAGSGRRLGLPSLLVQHHFGRMRAGIYACGCNAPQCAVGGCFAKVMQQLLREPGAAPSSRLFLALGSPSEVMGLSKWRFANGSPLIPRSSVAKLYVTGAARKRVEHWKGRCRRFRMARVSPVPIRGRVRVGQMRHCLACGHAE